MQPTDEIDFEVAGPSVLYGKVNLGAELVVDGQSTLNSLVLDGLITSLNTTNSTSPATGSMALAGGLGIGRDLHVAGDFYVGGYFGIDKLSVVSLDESTSATTGCSIFAGGIGVGKSIFIGKNLDVGEVTTLNQLHVASTTDALSISTAAGTFSGGVSVAKSLILGENLNVLGETNLSSLSVSGTLNCNRTTGNGLSVISDVIVGGVVTASAFTVSSDRRLKKNMSRINLDEASAAISLLKPTSFDWVDERRGKSRVSGFVAQEVREVIPTAVKEDENGVLSIEYSNVVSILIAAVKQLQKKVDELLAS